MKKMPILTLAAALAAGASAAQANVVTVRVSVQNLAPANSVSFAPLRLGFSNGTFDSFNTGTTATAPIISIAEGGSGGDWFPAFFAAEPNSVRGTVVPNPAGPLTPGATGFSDFVVDTAVNPYFTFGSMVVPSNDYFIGNDSPTQYRLFTGGGSTLQLTSINQTASDVWDAGSETEDPLGAAFLAIGNNSVRTPENGVVQRDFADLATTFNGLVTGAGYTFNSQLTASTDIYRIGFAIVPEPASLSLLGMAGLAGIRRRR